MHKNAPYILLVLAAFGLWFGVDLTQTHLDLVAPQGLKLDSWCDVNATFNCSAVNSSKWSAFTIAGRELPVAVPALGFFLCVAFLALTAARADGPERRRALGIIAGLSVPALLFSGWLLIVQVAILRAFCLKCLLLDAATLGTFVMALVGHGGGLGGVFAELISPPWKRHAMAAVVLLMGTGLPWSLYLDKLEDAKKRSPLSSAAAGSTETGKGDGGADAPKSAPQDDEASQIAEIKKAVAEFYAAYASVVAKEVAVAPTDGSAGNGMAIVTVVEFADFDCPHCKMAGVMIEQDFLPRYKDLVRFVFKHYPLGQKCNAALQRDLHPNACEAAVAVQCGGRVGKFWETHHAVFDKQGDLGRSTLLGIGRDLGFDPSQFEACLDDESAWEEVRQSVQIGRRLGLQGTPAFFVNGKELPSPHPLLVEAAVRAELKAAGVTDLPADPGGFFGAP